MAKIETSIQIAAPPELVFAFFVPQRLPYWYGAEMQACIEVQGGAPDFAVSQKVRVTGHMGRREVSHTAVVTELRRPQLFEWRFEDRYGVKGRERWELERTEPSAPPQTMVRFRSEYLLPGKIGRVMDWLFTRHAVARRNRSYLERLRRLIEHN
jgi:uncharacterized protein YndB with AHSA1/START domain